MQKNAAIANPFQNPLVRFITDKKYRWMRHTLFIVVGLLLAFKGDVGSANATKSPEEQRAILLVYGIGFAMVLGLIYFMVYVLIPKLLFRSRFFLFSVCMVIVCAFSYPIVIVLDNLFLKPLPSSNIRHIEVEPLGFLQVSFSTAVLFGAVMGLAVFKKWILDVQRMNELQQANFKTELEQLKSQVNPHFLFNTLNNLLVLTKTDPDKASQVLLGLSDLLRYQLYDSARTEIRLGKDVDFIRNFLELERLRKNDFAFSINVQGDANGVVLPPFLFIPFVENAVKHGASTVGHSYLNVRFVVEGKKLSFCAENSKPPVKNSVPGGLGLKNIQRRLQLLYPGNHSLRIQDDADKYSVHLTIPI